MQPALETTPEDQQQVQVWYELTGGIEHVSVAGIIAPAQVAREDAVKTRTQSAIFSTTFVVPP